MRLIRGLMNVPSLLADMFRLELQYELGDNG